MQRPMFVLVSEDAPKLATLTSDLERRYDRDYQVMAVPSASGARKCLADLAETDAEVALLIADEHLTEMPAVDFLADAHDLHPRAKRVMLTHRGDWSPTHPTLVRTGLLGGTPSRSGN